MVYVCTTRPGDGGALMPVFRHARLWEAGDDEEVTASVGKQTVDIEFRLSAYVDLAVGHGRNCEFHGVASPIAVSPRLRAVPELIVNIGRVIRVEDRRATSWRLGRAVQTVVNRPNYSIRGAGRRHGRGSPGEAEGVARLRHRRSVEAAQDGVEREGFQRAANSGNE